jgi:hypothetical protein
MCVCYIFIYTTYPRNFLKWRSRLSRSCLQIFRNFRNLEIINLEKLLYIVIFLNHPDDLECDTE